MSNRIKMSFVDKSVNVKELSGRKTVATIKSGFRFDNLDKVFDDLGFAVLPDPVVNVLYNLGYEKDYNLNMWVIKTKGVATCNTEDKYDSLKGRRIAISRAKLKAYTKALQVFDLIYRPFVKVAEISHNIVNDMYTYLNNEDVAIENVIDYGVSRPTEQIKKS